MRRLLPTLALAFVALPAAGASVQDDDLDRRLERLRTLLDEQREAHHVPGLSLAVVLDDEVVLACGLGFADLEAKRAAGPETVYAIGSTTKAFTSALIGMLVDEGKLSWDDPLTRHLPEFTPRVDRGASADGDTPITLRDALCHRTGFTRMGVLWAAGTASSAEVLHAAVRAEPWDGFREGFHYNNVMYLAAGEAAAVAAGDTWAGLIRARILEPLGMESATTSVAAAREDERLAAGYVWEEATGTHRREEMRVLDNIAPAGAINAHVLDVARWVRLQLGRGEFEGERLIAAETLAETWTSQIDVAPDVGYGLGWFVREWEGRDVIEHGGNIDGFAAQVAFLPDEGLGFVLLANVTATPLQQGSIPLVCEALLGEVPADDAPGANATAGTQASFDEYVGKYRANFSQFEDTDFTVLVQNDRLAVDVPGQMVFELKAPDDEGLWEFALPVGIAIHFERDAEGRVAEMILHQGGFAFGLPREGVELPPEVPLDELERFLGTFHDPALDEDLEVLVQNNRLSIDVPSQMVYELRPPDAEGVWLFRIGPELGLEFVEGEDGAVDSLVFHERGTERTLPRVGQATAKAGISLEELRTLRRSDERAAAVARRGAWAIEGTVRLVHSGVEGTFRIVAQGGDGYRMETDFGSFGNRVVVVDGERGWSVSSFDPFQELKGVYLEQARLEHPAVILGDWEACFDSVEVLRSIERDGRPVHEVRVRSGELPTARYVVDAETGDLLRSEGATLIEGIGQLPVTTRYEDYRESDGLRVPHRLISENDASGRTVLTIESIEDLEAVPAGTFAPPEPAPVREAGAKR